MSEENEHVTVTKEVRSTKKSRPLDSFESRGESPAKGLVEGVTKEELMKMVEEPKPVGPTSEYAEEGALTLATVEEAKVLVEDLSKRYGTPPGFVLVFKSKATGALSTYLTKNFYSALVERKGYSRSISLRPGAMHKPDMHRYHYIASLVPLIPSRAMESLRLLKDVDREEFLRVWKEWTAPIEEEGYADPTTVRMKTMRSDYNLERLARTRAYRHLAALYCGLSSGAEGEVEGAGEEREVAEAPVIEAKAEDVTPPKGV